MKIRTLTTFLSLVALTTALTFMDKAQAAIVVFDDFNVDEGHFASAPDFSGSNANIAATSTADRITTTNWEGAGNEQIVINTTTAGNATRLRFLSGVGTPANNLAFTTSAGVDGWIGMALRTTSPGWNAQLWIEGPEHNGGVPKEIIADGRWRIYKWNLDDETGGPNGWGSVAGIVGGDADVQNGSYTIDSVLFRHAAGPATATIYMDYVVRNTEGMIIPEPATCALALFSCIAPLSLARRRHVS